MTLGSDGCHRPRRGNERAFAARFTDLLAEHLSPFVGARTCSVSSVKLGCSSSPPRCPSERRALRRPRASVRVRGGTRQFAGRSGGRNLAPAYALVGRGPGDADDVGDLGDGVGPSAVGHRSRSGRRDARGRRGLRGAVGPLGYCSNNRCAVHGADRAQRGLIELLPRPHTRSLPPSAAMSE